MAKNNLKDIKNEIKRLCNISTVFIELATISLKLRSVEGTKIIYLGDGVKIDQVLESIKSQRLIISKS
ncbi:MAG: hypothetical protein K2X69_13450 [Silvanigrellaceae bacterium]|nr:hypothetical protein [Silvanigrellaceae bacterium]